MHGKRPPLVRDLHSCSLQLGQLLEQDMKQIGSQTTTQFQMLQEQHHIRHMVLQRLVLSYCWQIILEENLLMEGEFACPV